MPKRKLEDLTTSSSSGEDQQPECIHLKLSTQPISKVTQTSNTSQTPQKRQKTHNFKVGDAVSVSYRWTARIGYSYWAWTRKGQRSGYLNDSGKGSYDFGELSKDWKRQIRDQVVEEHLADWEYRIYHKEKFYWDYRSWKVAVRPVIRLNSIQVKDLDSVDLSSDISFS